MLSSQEKITHLLIQKAKRNNLKNKKMPRVHTVKKARKDYKEHGIKKGETYYWWKFRYGGKRVSKTYPRRSQLTQSGFLSQLYDLQDRIASASAECTDAESLQSFVDDIKGEIENLKDECESNLDNMPEHLKETSSSGELLTQRIEGLEQAIDELDSFDCDYEEPDENELRQEAIEELQLDDDSEEALQDQETEINAAIEGLKEDKLNEWIEEKVEELNNISFDF